MATGSSRMAAGLSGVMLGGALAAGLFASHAAPAQTILQKAERDEIAIVANDDPAMAAAIRKARATLGDFLTIAAAPKPTMENFAVKIAVHDGDQSEYFWIDPFTNDNGRFSGEINNKPEMVHTVKMGQLIAFGRDEIVDWMYTDGGKMKGNYTACAMLKSAPKKEAEEFKQRFGLTCEF
jgi:uncharacterized protein YegJ (DUF2314 family)